MTTPASGFQLLLHIDGTIVASRQHFGLQEAAEWAASHLTHALLPFNEGEPEDKVWVEVIDANDLPDEASTILPE